jgi:recombination protein RecT
MSTSLAVVERFEHDLEGHRDIFAAGMPEDLDKDRWFELARRAVRLNPKVLDCIPRTIWEALSDSATLGLELGGALGEAYVIPYGGEAKCIVGYKGLKTLCYRSPRVDVVAWEVVRDGDLFEHRLGTSPYVHHQPCGKQTDDWTHVYSIGRTVTGGEVVKVMSREQVLAHRDKYARKWQKRDSAWRKFEIPMAMKTVAVQAMRQLPLCVRAARVVEQSVYAETLPDTKSDGAIEDGSVTPIEDLDQLADELGGDDSPIGEEEAEAIRAREIEEANKTQEEMF